MTQTPAPPQTLLVHDGELADFSALLQQLGMPFTQRAGSLEAEDHAVDWDLVVATPKLILDLGLGHREPAPTQIAVLQGDSRTLRNSLQRAGIQLVVRRPVHRSALRALVLHALYKGPEKRRSVRVSIGATVRVRVGWRHRLAILADLSLGGCRLVSETPIARGSAIAVQIPEVVSGEKPFQVKGRVLRCAPIEGMPEDSHFALNTRFERVGKRTLVRLQSTVEAHRDGPAIYDGNGGASSEAMLGSPDSDRAAAAMAAGAEASHERRDADRRALERRVIALGDEASRVLMGRDISVGGMRVNSNPLLHVGGNFQLAIHVGGRDVPLVVRARVHRDDGERGVVLRFHELDPDASRYLIHMMDELPVVEGEGGEGHLVTEILATA